MGRREYDLSTVNFTWPKNLWAKSETVGAHKHGTPENHCRRLHLQSSELLVPAEVMTETKRQGIRYELYGIALGKAGGKDAVRGRSTRSSTAERDCAQGCNQVNFVVSAEGQVVTHTLNYKVSVASLKANGATNITDNNGRAVCQFVGRHQDGTPKFGRVLYLPQMWRAIFSLEEQRMAARV